MRRSDRTRRRYCPVLQRVPPNRPPLIALTAGVTDVPFGFELVESSRTRAFMERSAGSEAIFPTQMDTGLKLHGGYRFLRYAVAVVNGDQIDLTDQATLTQIAGAALRITLAEGEKLVQDLKVAR